MPQLTNFTSNSQASTSTASDATILNHDDMDVDEDNPIQTPEWPTTQVSNTLLQSGKVERQKERDERLQNGNIIPRKQQKVGKRLDSLIHRLVIERVGVKAISVSCPVYYRIGCDENVKNIARDRSLPHAYSCMVRKLSTIQDFIIYFDDFNNLRLLLATGQSYIERSRMSYQRT